MNYTNVLNHGLKTLALTAVCAGLVTPLHAADRARPSTAGPQVVSVALHDGGVLRGQLLDAQQRPLAKQQVRILSQGRLIVATETDLNGRFGARSLRGGLHTIESTGTSKAVQLWAPQTAPPSAEDVAVVLAGQELVVRGQKGKGKGGLHNGLLGEQPVRRLVVAGIGAGVLAWALDYNQSGS